MKMKGLKQTILYKLKLIIVKNTVAVTGFPSKVTNNKAPCPSARLMIVVLKARKIISI
jgi:hypothetical protein